MNILQSVEGRVTSLWFSPCGSNLLAVVEGDVIWDKQTFLRIKMHSGEVLDRHDFSGSSCATLSPDGSKLYHSVNVAVTGRECDLCSFDTRGSGRKTILQTDDLYVAHLDFSPNGRELALGGSDHCGDHRDYVWFIDPVSGKRSRSLYTQVRSMAYSPSGRLFATGGFFARIDDSKFEKVMGQSSDGVRIWEGAELVGRIDMPGWEIAWHPNGEKIASIGLNWVGMGLITEEKPAWAASLSGETGSMIRWGPLRFTAEGKHLLLGGLSGTVQIRCGVSGALVQEYDWGIGPIHSLAVSPDGTMAAAGGENGRIVLWDLDA